VAQKTPVIDVGDEWVYLRSLSCSTCGRRLGTAFHRSKVKAIEGELNWNFLDLFRSDLRD